MTSKSALKNWLLVFVLIIALPFVRLASVHAAASMTLTPAISTAVINTSKTFTITLNTDGTDVFGADIIISYPTGAFQFVSAQNGSFFTDFNYSVNQATGIIALHGYFSSLFQTKNGTGTAAEFTLKAITSSGNATISYVCGGNGQSTQVIDADGDNIISCGHLTDSTVSFTGSATPTPSPIIGGTDITPTPTNKPGNNIPVCDSLSISPSSGSKPLGVTFTCSGTDSDNDLTAAEFSFGNSSSQIVEKNVGQYGSFTTSYTYITAGTYLVSCRLRDNNYAFSQTPAECQKSILVTTATGPTPTPTPKSNSNDTDDKSSGVPLVYTGATPTPVTLKPYVTPTPIPELVTTINGANSTDSGWWTGSRISQLITMVVVSIITVVVAILLKRHFDAR